MLEFHAFCRFLSESSAWSYELNDGAEFCAFLLLEKLEILGKKMGKYMYSMQNNVQFCSAPQAHWVHQNKCITGLIERLLRGMHFWVF